MQKYTDAKRINNRKWDAANLDRLSVAMPKGRKDAVKAHSQALGESVNGFINRAILETMERDSVTPAAPSESSEAAAGHEDLKDIPQADQSGETAPPAADDLG